MQFAIIVLRDMRSNESQIVSWPIRQWEAISRQAASNGGGEFFVPESQTLLSLKAIVSEETTAIR